MDCVVDALSRGLCVESRLRVLLIRRAACRSQPSPHSDSVINLGGGCGADHCCAASLYQAAVFLARRGLRSRVATRSFSGRNLWATRVRPILSENLSWCHRAAPAFRRLSDLVAPTSTTHLLRVGDLLLGASAD